MGSGENLSVVDYLSYSEHLSAANNMSLKIKCASYDTTFVRNFEQLESLTNEMRVLLAGGYHLNIDISATNFSNMLSKQRLCDFESTTTPTLQQQTSPSSAQNSVKFPKYYEG